MSDKQPDLKEVKALGEFEIETGVFFNGDVNVKEKLSRQEFLDRTREQAFTLVNHPDRTKWLKANDYELTRENLLNPHLLSKD